MGNSARAGSGRRRRATQLANTARRAPRANSDRTSMLVRDVASAAERSCYATAPRGACFIDAGEACHLPFALTVAGERCVVSRRSNRYSPDCQHLGQQQPRPLLVTGTGRSGTFFLSSVLQRLGLAVSHDRAPSRPQSSRSSQSSRSAPTRSTAGGFKHGAVSWPHAFRTCLPAYTFRRLSAQHPGDVSNQQLHDQRLFRTVAHLVRTPLAAINSRFNNGSVRSRTYAVTSQCNLDLRLDHALSTRSRKLQLALQHWVLWNSFAEATSQLHLSLERVDAAALRTLIERAEIRLAPPSPHEIDAAIRVTTLAAGGRNSARTVKLDRLTPVCEKKSRPDGYAQFSLQHALPAPGQAQGGAWPRLASANRLAGHIPAFFYATQAHVEDASRDRPRVRGDGAGDGISVQLHRRRGGPASDAA